MYANTVGEAFIYYGIRLVVFTAVAALAGIKLRRNKDKKQAE